MLGNPMRNEAKGLLQYHYELNRCARAQETLVKIDSKLEI
jgi:hypothetical protein